MAKYEGWNVDADGYDMTRSEDDYEAYEVQAVVKNNLGYGYPAREARTLILYVSEQTGVVTTDPLKYEATR